MNNLLFIAIFTVLVIVIVTMEITFNDIQDKIKRLSLQNAITYCYLNEEFHYSNMTYQECFDAILGEK